MADPPVDSKAGDELDPELLKLSKPRTRVGWLLSLAVVVLCAYWMGKLRSDLAFSRQGGEPVAVEAAEIAKVASDRYVSLRAVPDRARVARVHYGADLGSHVAPVLGSGGSLWLLTPASAFAPASTPDGARSGDRYTGRVKRLDEMPFFDQLRQFFAALPVFEPLEVSQAIAALTSGATEIETAHGDHLELDRGAAVEVVRRIRGRALIVATSNPNGRSDELSWRSALTRAGVLSHGDQPITDSPESWTYEIPAPAGLAPIEKKLADAGLAGAAVMPVEKVYTTTWGQLQVRGSEVVAGDTAMPAAEITTVAVAHRPPLPGDAVVVVATESPSDYWYILWLYGLFGAVILLFGWSLIKALRGSEPPTPQPAS